MIFFFISKSKSFLKNHIFGLTSLRLISSSSSSAMVNGAGAAWAVKCFLYPDNFTSSWKDIFGNSYFRFEDFLQVFVTAHNSNWTWIREVRADNIYAHTVLEPKSSSFKWPPPNSFFSVALVAANNIFLLTCKCRVCAIQIHNAWRSIKSRFNNVLSFPFVIFVWKVQTGAKSGT